MPKILLTGKWLQDIGFTEGGFITVLYKKQKMVIQLKKYTNDEINFRNMKQEEEEKRLANAQRRKERRCNFGWPAAGLYTVTTKSPAYGRGYLLFVASWFSS